MNILNIFREQLLAAVKECYGENTIAALESNAFAIEFPKNLQFGDLSSNIANVLAKILGQNPRAIALTLQEALASKKLYAKVEVAGANFINATLYEEQYTQLLEVSLLPDFFAINKGQGQRINFEYVSANPTGPMHIGHARGAIYGEALARIFQYAGFAVDREYYINDAGRQIEVLTDSVLARIKELQGEPFSLPEGGYPADYIIPVAKSALQQFGVSVLEAITRKELKKFVVDRMLDIIRVDLALLKIKHDIFVSEESDVKEAGLIDEAVLALRALDLVYEGRLPPPKGKKDQEWEARDQLLFRSTAYGDDMDRPLFKPDGEHTYVAADIGYHLYKIKRGYHKMFLTVGADHAGYVERIQASVQALAPEVDFRVVVYQLVKFMKDGEPFKMSKRAGTFLTVEDVLAEIDADSLKFLMLTHKADTIMEIDFAKAKEQSKDNPVFYVQYAHARACSVLRKAPVEALGVKPKATSMYLFNAHEKAILKMIHSFEKSFLSAMEHFEPLKLINYVLELARQFHSLWNLEGYYFIGKELDEGSCWYRIRLVKAVQGTLHQALEVLGIVAATEM